MEDNKSRQEEIRQKGFRMADQRRSYYAGPVPLNNASIKIGKQTLQDAILDLGYLKKVNGKLGNKFLVLKALWEKDLNTLREISNYFYRTNGIYFRVVNSFATIFRYDWFIAPEVKDENAKEDKILEDFDENPKSILQKEGESIVSNTFPHWMIWSDIIVLSW